MSAFTGKSTQAVEAELKASVRVLYVDDSAFARATVLAALIGFDVVALDNGVEAIERARSAAENGAPFNLFVFDIEMSPVDGFALLEELRTCNAYVGTKVAFLSGSRREEHARRVQELGATLIDKQNRGALREEFLALLRSR